MIKVIAFDFAGVIIPTILTNWLKSNEPDENKREAIFDEVTRKSDLGEIGLEGFLEIIGKNVNIPREKVFDTIYGNVKLSSSVFSLVHKLKENYSVVLFSNNTHELVHKLLENNSAMDVFNEIIVSSQFGIRKPNPAFFKKMLEIANVKEGEVIFIDDSQINVDTGNKLGIKSLLFTNAGVLKEELRSLGVKL